MSRGLPDLIPPLQSVLNGRFARRLAMLRIVPPGTGRRSASATSCGRIRKPSMRPGACTRGGKACGGTSEKWTGRATWNPRTPSRSASPVRGLPCVPRRRPAPRARRRGASRDACAHTTAPGVVGPAVVGPPRLPPARRTSCTRRHLTSFSQTATSFSPTSSLCPTSGAKCWAHGSMARRIWPWRLSPPQAGGSTR